CPSSAFRSRWSGSTGSTRCCRSSRFRPGCPWRPSRWAARATPACWPSGSSRPATTSSAGGWRTSRPTSASRPRRRARRCVVGAAGPAPASRRRPRRADFQASRMPDPRDAAERPAWPVVLAVAGALGVVLVLLAGRYGYHRDELYFIVAGGHPAWGYPDQPPLTPFVAWAAERVGGGNLAVFRLPAVGVAVAVTVLAALIARE